MKKFLVTLMAIGAIATIIPASSANAAPYCGITWGSLPKTASSTGSGQIGQVQNVRTGRHDCYDRFVIDNTTSAPGYDVRYVPQVTADGSGQPVPLKGGAFLQIITHAPINDVNGHIIYPAKFNKPLPGVDLTGYKTFKEAKYAGSFEGQTTFGLGVRATLPFRVLLTDNHTVIDVAHKW